MNTFAQAISNQKFDQCRVVKVRRIDNAYRCTTKAGDIHDLELSFGQRLFGLVLCEPGVRSERVIDEYTTGH